MIQAVALQRLSDDLRRAMGANPHASFAEVIEALALIASDNAAECVPGCANQTSWDNASSRLFDLAQVGRLYRAI